MSKWSFAVTNLTPVAVADANAFTDSGYMALQGGSSTQMNDIQEVQIIGQAGSSSPTPLLLARDSTVGATLTALSTPNSNGALHPSVAALGAVPTGFIASTTKPQRASSVTLAKLAMAINAFGGILRWLAAPGEEFSILGNTASLGEASLSCFTGGTPGAISAHFIYEPR